MKSNSGVFLLLESMNEGWKYGKELRKSHLESEVLHYTQGGFVVLLIEAANFYINSLTKSIAFHVPSFQ